MNRRVTLTDGTIIEVVGTQDVESVLEAHGYDPENTEWSVKNANEYDNRIDDLEQRICELEEQSD